MMGMGGNHAFQGERPDGGGQVVALPSGGVAGVGPKARVLLRPTLMARTCFPRLSRWFRTVGAQCPQILNQTGHIGVRPRAF